MEWEYCKKCSKVVDENEKECYWCGTPKKPEEDFLEKNYNSKKDAKQLRLFS
jgi:rRNA maturation endonuclease Nob1